MILREYRFEDLLIMPPRESEVEVARLELETPEIFANRAMGPAFTVCFPSPTSTPVACGGVIVFQPHVGEAWLRGSIHLKHVGLSVARIIKRKLAALMVEYDLHRVQMTVRSETDRPLRFALWLGFEYEGRLRKLGSDGVDYFMMACVNGGQQ